jgi:hypothetical protein
LNRLSRELNSKTLFVGDAGWNSFDDASLKQDSSKHLKQEGANPMQFDTVSVVAIIVIVIGAGYLILKRRSRA